MVVKFGPNGGTMGVKLYWWKLNFRNECVRALAFYSYQSNACIFRRHDMDAVPGSNPQNDHYSVFNIYFPSWVFYCLKLRGVKEMGSHSNAHLVIMNSPFALTNSSTNVFAEGNK